MVEPQPAATQSIKDGETPIGSPTRNRTPGLQQGQSVPASASFALGEKRPD